MEIEIKYRHIFIEEQDVWITDYRHLNITQKAIRHVKPTKGQLRTRRSHFDRHYYSFFPYKKNGELKAHEINLYDNTSYPVPVKVFTTEQEARVQYREMYAIILDDLQGHRDYIIEQYNEMNKTFKKLKV